MSIIYLADYFIDWINFKAISFLKKITIKIEKYLYFLQKGQKSTKNAHFAVKPPKIPSTTVPRIST